MRGLVTTEKNDLNPLSWSELHAELSGRETLVWTGQLLRRVIFHARDWFAIPFSLMWGGFAVFWEMGVTGHVGARGVGGAPSFMQLWGVPFVLGAVST